MGATTIVAYQYNPPHGRIVRADKHPPEHFERVGQTIGIRPLYSVDENEERLLDRITDLEGDLNEARETIKRFRKLDAMADGIRRYLRQPCHCGCALGGPCVNETRKALVEFMQTTGNADMRDPAQAAIEQFGTAQALKLLPIGAYVEGSVTYHGTIKRLVIPHDREHTLYAVATKEAGEIYISARACKAVP